MVHSEPNRRVVYNVNTLFNLYVYVMYDVRSIAKLIPKYFRTGNANSWLMEEPTFRS